MDRRLIDRDDLLRFFTFSPAGERYKTRDVDNFPITVELKAVQKKIAVWPLVDAVEVVRCEKCSHGIPAEDADIPNCYMCVEAAEYDPESGLYAGFTSYHTGDFFCGYGERRNNG